MTKKQKTQINTMRKKGLSYQTMSEKLGLPKGTIKTYCWRSNIAPPADGGQLRCKHCEKPFEMKARGRQKIFCCDKCRIEWWSNEENRRTDENATLLTCANCGRTFAGYGKRKLKYCQHSCYINHRFKNGGGKSD